jgi:ribosome-associated toxin RatA of RatAB toxin-antitoxin module
MKHVKRSVLLWYAPSEMYSLVTAVEQYPQFLPWCESAQVLEQHADGVTARLALAVLGLRQHFTTRNVHAADSSVQLKLIDGPFSKLEGRWDFHALVTPGGAAHSAWAAPGTAAWAASGALGALGASSPRACRTELNLRYAFSSSALQSVVGPAFDRIADTLVDSFVKRAEAVYGPRAG